jgi:hypothetical protein
MLSMRQGFELIKYLVIRCLGDKLHKFLLLWNCNLLNINGIKNKLAIIDDLRTFTGVAA